MYLEACTDEGSTRSGRCSDDLDISLLAVLCAGYTLLPVSGGVRAAVKVIEQFMLLCRERAHTSLVILRRLRCRSVFGTWDHYRQRAISLLVVYWHCNKSSNDTIRLINHVLSITIVLKDIVILKNAKSLLYNKKTGNAHLSQKVMLRKNGYCK